jgi:hypothetical protein
MWMMHRKTSAAWILVFLLVGGTLLAGCKSAGAIRADNRESLRQLERGMTQSEVLDVMGTKTYRDQYNDQYTNPHRTETLPGSDGDQYTVLFYYTDLKRQDGAVTDDELTPLVLRNNELIGWGWSYLEEDGNSYTVRIR